MRAIFGLVLIIGMGLAGFAVYMVKGYFDQQNANMALVQQRAAEQIPTVEVLAVNRVIAFGEQITVDDVDVIRYAEPFLPEGIFTTAEELFPRGADVPRSATRQMEANEPILAAKVTDAGEQVGITTRLSAGMRAFTIEVDAASGVSGFLRPGDRVDVYWSGQVGVGDQGRQDMTQLIDTGLTIIAIDQSADANRPGTAIARTVTVEVSPQQVARLLQAQSSGELALSLVGYADDTIATANEVNQRSLLGIVESAPVIQAAPEVAEVCTIRTRRGAEVVELEIPCTN